MDRIDFGDCGIIDIANEATEEEVEVLVTCRSSIDVVVWGDAE